MVCLSVDGAEHFVALSAYHFSRGRESTCTCKALTSSHSDDDLEAIRDIYNFYGYSPKGNRATERKVGVYCSSCFDMHAL